MSFKNKFQSTVDKNRRAFAIAFSNITATETGKSYMSIWVNLLCP
jgi:hypothetical protein